MISPNSSDFPNTRPGVIRKIKCESAADARPKGASLKSLEAKLGSMCAPTRLLSQKLTNSIAKKEGLTNTNIRTAVKDGS